MEKKKITSRRSKVVNKRAKVAMVKSVEGVIEKVIRKVWDNELKERVAEVVRLEIQKIQNEAVNTRLTSNERVRGS